MQAEIAGRMIERGIEVHVFNQRSVQGIMDMILMLGAMVGAQTKALALIETLTGHVDQIQNQAARLARRPAVYFKEWNDPLISGIGWVSELIEIAGGDDCFREQASHPEAKKRIIHDSEEVVRRRPDIINRFLVWQEIPARYGQAAARVAANPGRAGWIFIRDQVRQYSAIRPGCLDRRPDGITPDHGGVGKSAAIIHFLEWTR